MNSAMEHPLNMERVCRTCLNERDNMVSMFYDDAKQNCKIAVMITACSEMMISDNDGMPDKICQECVEAARKAFAFRQQCNLSYRTLCSLTEQYNPQRSVETVLGSSKNLPQSSSPSKRCLRTNRSGTASSVQADSKTKLVEYVEETSEDRSKLNTVTVDCKMEMFETVEYLADSFDEVVKRIKNEPIIEDETNRLDMLEEATADPPSRHECEHCHKVFVRAAHYRRHLLTHTKDKPFSCQHCEKTFNRKDHLKKHESSLHPEAADQKSPESNSSPELDSHHDDGDFDNDSTAGDEDYEPGGNSTLSAKTSEHGKKEPKEPLGKYPCEYCEKIFGRTTHLKRHILTHTKEKLFQCTVCSKAFARSDHLAKHEATSHSHERPHACQLCEKTFKRAEHLRNHVEAKHSDKAPNQKTEICDVCKKGFTTAKSLEIHRKGHFEQKAIGCKYCGIQFTDRIIYRQHLKDQHLQGKGFLCSECGQSFVRNDYLMVHMRRHNGIKPYKCKFCPKAFPRATDLNVHEKYHTNDKSHLCTICGKGFHRAYNLVVHSRTHNGLKPYQCPHCPKCFAQGNDLKAHIRRHTGERYKCEICDEGFIQFYQLTNHKRSVHNIDPSKMGRRVTKYVTPNAQQQQVLLQKHHQQLEQLLAQQRELEQQQLQGWSFEHVARDPDLEKKILETRERIQDVEREVDEINSRLNDELGRQEELLEDNGEPNYPHPSYGQQFLNDPSSLPLFAGGGSSTENSATGTNSGDSAVKIEKSQGH